jgi:CRISPR-associated protein Cas1
VAEERALYLNTPGLHVGRSSEVLQVRDEGALLEEIRISDLHHVALFGNIQISTQTIQMLCEKDIPVTYFSMGGWFYGLTRGHALKNIFTRIRQFALAADPAACLPLAQQFIHGKIRNQRTLLQRNHITPPEGPLLRLKRASQDALEADSLPSLLGIEGAAAALYFEHFSGMLKPRDELDFGTESATPAWTFDFTTRNRRPPRDPVNALLSLAYSLLAKDCLIAAHATGFDPYLGFYHQPRFGRPALALDLMEEFRPLIADSVVLTLLNNQMLTPGHFVQAGDSCNLSPPGRKIFFQAYERRMQHLITHPIFDYKVSYRRALELQARLLAAVCTGELPTYPPFLTR